MTSVLEAVRSIGPELAKHSPAIEANRTLPDDVVDLVRPTGAFRMYVPTELDGPQVPAWESLQVIEELAYHDGATGWCAMIGSTTSLLSNYLPDPHAAEIFTAPEGIGGGFAMPNGRAVATDGGLRVTGTWQWGSGTRHCSWIGGGARLVDADGAPAPREDGLAAPFVFFPADDVEFIDNWDVSGLSGTGSGDYRVDDVFVPEGRWVQVGIDPPRRGNDLARFSFFGLLACGVASTAMGIGRRAVDELIDLAGAKKPQGSRKLLRDRSEIQTEVAKAEAMLRSAWAFMEQSVSSAWETAVAGDTPTVEQRRSIRLSATHATHTAAEATRAMYTAGGGAAVYRTSPLQRCFRDVSVATQHAMVAPVQYQVPGRLRLGVETDTRTL
ncbi:MAG: acyl-CoA dehydrogenase family protein [Actinomycetota bacterium]